jgi:hypothetical protein
MPSIRGLLTVALVAFAVPAMAAEPVNLGDFGNWTAYAASGADGKVCYALSKPTATLPKKAARDPIYIIISTWPGRGVTDEVQVVPGYTYRDGDPVWVQVGGYRTEFFARNDGKNGSAWVKNLDDESQLVSTMRGGSSLTASGVSKRGTKTTDTYSLRGITGALDRAHRECGR